MIESVQAVIKKYILGIVILFSLSNCADNKKAGLTEIHYYVNSHKGGFYNILYGENTCDKLNFYFDTANICYTKCGLYRNKHKKKFIDILTGSELKFYSPDFDFSDIDSNGIYYSSLFTDVINLGDKNYIHEFFIIGTPQSIRDSSIDSLLTLRIKVLKDYMKNH